MKAWTILVAAVLVRGFFYVPDCSAQQFAHVTSVTADVEPLNMKARVPRRSGFPESSRALAGVPLAKPDRLRYEGSPPAC